MKDKKEMVGYTVAIIALIGCCLLLPILLAGGALTIAGGYFNSPWIVAGGIALIVVAMAAFIWERKRGKKDGKKEN